MTNYYEVLSTTDTKLNRSDSAATLRSKLIVLESLWTDRAAQRPEKAMEMLNLINQAKKVFADDKAKAAYDNDLFAPQKQEKPADPNAARKSEFERWRKTAENYRANNQFDLAKTAIEQAVKYLPDDDSDFFHLAAVIYRENADYQTALNYINKAIVLDPQEVELYVAKAQIYEKMYLHEKKYDAGKAEGYNQQARTIIRSASEMAGRQKDLQAQARADGVWAYLLYFYEPYNQNLATVLATRAYKFNDVNAGRVLDANRRRKEERERQEAESRANAERWAREQEANEKRKREEEQRRKEKEEREKREREIAAERRREYEALKRKVDRKRCFCCYIMFPVPIALAAYSFIAGIVNACGGSWPYSRFLLTFMLFAALFILNFCTQAFTEPDKFELGGFFILNLFSLGIAAVIYMWMGISNRVLDDEVLILGLISFVIAIILGTVLGRKYTKNLQEELDSYK